MAGLGAHRGRLLPARVRRTAARPAGRRGGQPTPPGVEPHDLELRRTTSRSPSADLVLLLGHGFQPQLEAAAGSGRRVVRLLDTHGLRRLPNNDPHVWLDPVRYALIVKRIGAALHRPQAGRAARRPPTARSTREYRRGLRPLRPTRDRHEPRGLRLPRPALRPPAGRDHRAQPRGRAHAGAAAGGDRARPEDRSDDGLLRDARLAADRRHGRARDRGSHGRAQPDRGPDAAEEQAGERLLLASCAPTSRSLRLALGCR